MNQLVKLTVPLPVLNGSVSSVAEFGDDGVILMQCGIAATDEGLELLQRSVDFGTDCAQLIGSATGSDLCPLLLTFGRQLPSRNVIERALRAIGANGFEVAAFLAVLRGERNAEFHGWVRFAGERNVTRIDELFLPGAGMLRAAVLPLWPMNDSSEPNIDERQAAGKGGTDSRAGTDSLIETVSGEEMETMDRMITFLGRGDKERGMRVYETGTRARVAVVGGGMAGGRVSTRLAQGGVGKHGWLVCIDPDKLEAVNRYGKLAPPETIGMYKAEILSRLSDAFGFESRIQAMPVPLSNDVATEVVAASDVTIVAADNEETSVYASVITERYNRVLFDVKSGTTAPGRDLKWGGEARGDLPGDQPCAACMRETDWSEVIAEMSLSPTEWLANREGSIADKERAGTMPALVDMAVSQALMLFWRLYMGELNASVWFHLNADELKPDWQDWTNRARRNGCRVCSPQGIRGLGDIGLYKGGAP